MASFTFIHKLHDEHTFIFYYEKIYKSVVIATFIYKIER